MRNNTIALNPLQSFSVADCAHTSNLIGQLRMDKNRKYSTQNYLAISCSDIINLCPFRWFGRWLCCTERAYLQDIYTSIPISNALSCSWVICFHFCFFVYAIAALFLNFSPLFVCVFIYIWLDLVWFGLVSLTFIFFLFPSFWSRTKRLLIQKSQHYYYYLN